MTIANAVNFIKRGVKDPSLRKTLNMAKSSKEMFEILDAEEMSFSAHDFDEAYHSCLFKCQEEEQANHLKEFKMWWEFLSMQYGEPLHAKK